MTQEERWLQQWQTVMDFMEANKRRPSKFIDEERAMRNWWKHQQKLLNAGELKHDRIEKFNELIEELAERAREEQKKPMDIEAIRKMYEEESRKIRY